MKDQEGIRANRPADIEPAKVSKNLITTMKKCSPDEDWRFTKDIVLYNDIAIYEAHHIHENPFDGVSECCGFSFAYILKRKSPISQQIIKTHSIIQN